MNKPIHIRWVYLTIPMFIYAAIAAISGNNQLLHGFNMGMWFTATMFIVFNECRARG